MPHPNLRIDLILTELQIRLLSNNFEVVQISRNEGVSLLLLQRGPASVVIAKGDRGMVVNWANNSGYFALGFSGEELGIPRPMDVEDNP